MSLALEWLKLNHIDYFDIEISYNNLKAYPEDAPPVLIIDYHSSTSNKNHEATAVNDTVRPEGWEKSNLEGCNVIKFMERVVFQDCGFYHFCGVK